MRNTRIILLAIIFAITLPIIAKNGLKSQTDNEKMLKEMLAKADNFRDNNQKDSALFLYSDIYHRYSKEMTDMEQYYCAMAYLNSARMLYFANNFPESLELYLKGLRIIENCSNKERIAEFYIGLADIYWLNQDLEMAEKCYKTGYGLAIDQKDTASIVNISNMLTGINCYLEDHSEAMEYMKTANATNKDTINQQYLNLLHKGIMYANDKQYEKAAELFRISGKLAHDNNMHPKFECSSYEELYKIYIKTNDRDSTKKYLFKCYDILQQTPMVNMLPLCLKSISDFYKLEDDYETAYKYIYEYHEVMDSVFKFRDINKLRNIHTMYETEKVNDRITSLQKQSAKKEETIKKQNITIAGMLIGILCIISIAIYIYKQKQELAYLYRKLFAMNSDISSSEQYNRELRMKYEKELIEKSSRIEELEERLKRNNGTETEENKEISRKALKKMDSDRQLSLKSAIDEIMENTTEFCSTDFSLDKLAELVHSNNTYVSQIINESYNRTFYNLVNEYRIREAKKRLGDTDTYGHLTIKAISESVGYKSQTTFIKLFRETTGMTPSMYQKISRNKGQ